MSRRTADVLVVGGGHNGLVAAAYLARAGLAVRLFEAGPVLGGAVAGAEVFPGVAARLSRWSYLVSLLPEQLVDDLGLRLQLRSRRVASYTPVGDAGLLVERTPGAVTSDSFLELTGDTGAYADWESFYARWAVMAGVIAPTLLGPLPRAGDIRAAIGDENWRDFVQRPLGRVLCRTFADDTVRGVVATDALIGTFADLDGPSLIQNRCFLYHLIGRGTGEWRVPVGGMGAVADALVAAAVDAGVVLETDAAASAISPSGSVRVGGEEWQARHVLAGCAPSVLTGLLAASGVPDPVAAPPPEGCQVKINLLLRRLPRFRSGIDPETGFAGTLHLGQGYARLGQAYAQAAAGRLPDPLPCEVYCHTLTDSSVLAPDLVAAGFHTLTLFGLHTPAALFRADPDGTRRQARDAALRSLQAVLAEPLEDCLALDARGDPCIEVKTPLDVETTLRMPGGHIFHGDLDWPWLGDDDVAETPAGRWGVATPYDRILLCGSGSRRGGAVSGLGGHSAAQAVLEELG